MADTPPAPPTKVWWQSKTIILNALSMIALVLQMQEFSAVIPARFIPFEMLALGLVNIALRVISTSTIVAEVPRSPSDSPK